MERILTKEKTNNFAKTVLKYLIVISIVFFVSIPLLWMVLSSLKTGGELYSSTPIFFPKHITFDNFRELETVMKISIFMKNSLIVAIGTVVVCLVLSTVGAYVLTRFRFRGRRVLANITLLTYAFPSMLLALPLFLIFAKIGISNNLWNLVLGHTTFSFPFTLWFLWAFFKTIPIQLEEAAMLDGATRLRVIWSVVLPVSMPGIIAVSIFTFIVSWNDYLFALIMISSESLKTVPLALSSLAGLETMSWGLIMAAGVVISMPPIVFFIFIQKHMVKGFGVGVT